MPTRSLFWRTNLMGTFSQVRTKELPRFAVNDFQKCLTVMDVLLPLLPLREKVSAEPTDEGLIIQSARAQPTAAAAVLLFNPSPDPLRGPPSPARGEGIPTPLSSALTSPILPAPTSLVWFMSEIVREVRA
ncbi:hypothetical protein ASC70_21740 [Caulobacter sp. Root343]|nr:hypothetical protein ASC62_20905 [Caulobacter sp. Root342]KQV63707.1 hypothetical protein ASC70_21740 [Caulobacter sp. Root343]